MPAGGCGRGKNGWQYRTEEEFLKDLKNWKEKEDDERRGMCSYAKQSAEIFPKKICGKYGATIPATDRRKTGRKRKTPGKGPSILHPGLV